MTIFTIISVNKLIQSVVHTIKPSHFALKLVFIYLRGISSNFCKKNATVGFVMLPHKYKKRS